MSLMENIEEDWMELLKNISTQISLLCLNHYLKINQSGDSQIVSETEYKLITYIKLILPRKFIFEYIKSNLKLFRLFFLVFGSSGELKVSSIYCKTICVTNIIHAIHNSSPLGENKTCFSG